MSALISIILLVASISSKDPNYAIASGLFAIGAEIASYTHHKFGDN